MCVCMYIYIIIIIISSLDSGPLFVFVTNVSRPIMVLQARDSGRPPLSSMTVVHVRVIEESVHVPVASPLHVHIVTVEDEFPGGVIGQIHATDQDAFDILTYGHTHQQNSLFKVCVCACVYYVCRTIPLLLIY